MSSNDSDCSTYISFKKTGFFSAMMCDYIEKSNKITPFYSNYPDLEGFKNQIETKQESFTQKQRETLVTALQEQYKGFKLSNETSLKIASLSESNTFTVTTGHQLNLFTGPLYFLYKIIATINLSEKLTLEFPEKNFVPIYWMATEDHDFDEINFFKFKGKKIQWNSDQTGAVGRFSTDGLQEVFTVFKQLLGTSKRAKELFFLFEEGYIKHENLAGATRYIANELFAKYGLVIIDGDDAALKEEFIPFVEKELLEQISYNSVTETNSKLSEVYNIQVNPREINLFYLKDDIRERIVFENDIYKVNNTDIEFSKEEILKELNAHPKRFSPNVIMRPLYQEVILPNLAYIGGGGEMAYWMQLKKYFENIKVPFPILLLRNSVQVINEKQYKKLSKLSISIEELFLKQNELLKKKVLEKSEVKFDFSKQKKFLENQFENLKKIAEQTDASFIGAVNAQEKKQLKGLLNLEKRFLRAEKRKEVSLVERIKTIQNELLPNLSLEERQRNFSEFYLEYGEDFVTVLKEKLNPLQLEFFVLVK